jgi:ferritin-like protein
LKKNNLIIISYAGKAIEQMINLVKNVFNKADVLSYDYKYSLYAMKGKKHEVVKEYLIVAYEN